MVGYTFYFMPRTSQHGRLHLLFHAQNLPTWSATPCIPGSESSIVVVFLTVPTWGVLGMVKKTTILGVPCMVEKVTSLGVALHGQEIDHQAGKIFNRGREIGNKHQSLQETVWGLTN